MKSRNQHKKYHFRVEGGGRHGAGAHSRMFEHSEKEISQWVEGVGNHVKLEKTNQISHTHSP